MAKIKGPHWEALTRETRAAFDLCARLPFIGEYYLAGGTGLALHLGHRFSIDLDLFSPRADSVGPDERATIRVQFDDPSLTITHDKDGIFVGTWRGVGLSFFRLNSYPLVQSPWLVGGVPIATLEEIGAMKLAAIIDRGARKDLVDLFFILKEIEIERLFQVAAVKYARISTFAVTATRALSYFEDAAAQPMPRMIKRTRWETMKRFLEQQALAVGRKHLERLWE